MVLLYSLYSDGYCWQSVRKSVGIKLKMQFPVEVVLIGSTKGVSECFSHRLLEAKMETKSISIIQPKSGFITERPDPSTLQGTKSSSIVVAIDDHGYGIDKTTLEEDELTNNFTTLLASKPACVIYVASMMSVEQNRKNYRNALSRAFAKTSLRRYESYCVANGIAFILLTYGTLIGGVPASQPLPFLGMPSLEPELDPSYVLQSLVCSPLYSPVTDKINTEPCTRSSMSEMILYLIQHISQRINDIQSSSTQLISIAGSPPTQREWKAMINKVMSREGLELLRIEFAQIVKPKELASWLCDSWFSQALIDSNAATISSGARPVRALKTSPTSVKIQWQELLLPDLTVRPAGALEIQIVDPFVITSKLAESEIESGKAEVVGEEEIPHIRVVRTESNIPLPGEAQLVERLVEGINKNVYKKKFCIPI